ARSRPRARPSRGAGAWHAARPSTAGMESVVRHRAAGHAGTTQDDRGDAVARQPAVATFVRLPVACFDLGAGLAADFAAVLSSAFAAILVLAAGLAATFTEAAFFAAPFSGAMIWILPFLITAVCRPGASDASV